MKLRYVLSLFDGMSCGQIALKEIGFIPERYYASEIDKHAIKQTQLNFPDTIQLGDVTKWKEWDIEWSKVDLILAGSPCQGFSFAGKQLAFDDPRSVLFFVFVDILKHVRKFNPEVKFLLENVNMKREHMRIINETLGVFPVNINSALVSAQNRNRWYWTNIRTKMLGLFCEVYSDIPQPEDRGIFLRNILESEVDEKYYVSQAVLDRMNRKMYSSPAINPEKTGALNTKNNSAQMSLDLGTTFISVDGKAPTQRCATGRSLDKAHNYQFIKVNIDGNISKNQDKSSCFTAGAHSGGYHSDMDLICVAMCGRNKDNLILTPNYVQWDSSGKGHKSQNNRAFYESGRHGALTTSGYEKTGVVIGQRIRRLTPKECDRLQTIPDWYKWECSETQQYKMLGNGWTVQVIIHILSFF